VNDALYIGLMSGTSADSLDAVLVNFQNNSITILATHSLALSEELRTSIHQLAVSGNHEIAQLCDIDKKIALLSCSAIEHVCKKAHVSPKMIQAIGSHGQTLRHKPQDAAGNGYSLQVGDPNIIAEKTGITTIADFRRRDIAAGGHGAPLAPAFHQAAFYSSGHDRIILNTGGIANITYISKQGSEVFGYDTGPANGLMDSWCQQHRNTPYDNHGEWASTGTINTDLLAQLLAHPFFSLPYPKSTGREDFNLPWLKNELTHFPKVKIQDVQATLLALTVESIAQSIEAHDQSASAEIYVCGGGSKNIALMNSLSKRLGVRPVASTDVLGISSDWVEAVAFAWLAKQTMNKVTGNLPSVTGANHPVILGGVYWGND
jgi:anhydro-N-acetylmuramic acid kinase